MKTPNYDAIKRLFDSIVSTLEQKNHDYDNAFAKMCEEFGNMYAVSKIAEKYARIKKLSKEENKVPGEGLIDAVIDCIGYLALYYDIITPEEEQPKEENVQYHACTNLYLDDYKNIRRLLDNKIIISNEAIKAMLNHPLDVFTINVPFDYYIDEIKDLIVDYAKEIDHNDYFPHLEFTVNGASIS